jgi:4-amino-4-deoxy-L-arabinose transferase-like glycosyltransferase
MDSPAAEGSQRYFWVRVALAIFVVGFAFFHLTDFPTPWFDEGVHLHVPETLVRYGVYADRSSDGFRYFGPTLGVGPTVMLPIAGAFKIFGIGLLQARVVMALFLVAAVYVFYRFARMLHGTLFAFLALALLITSPSVALMETGRQVLGEVPALLMLAAAFWLWFSAWDGSWTRLTLAGLLFGAAAITKYQNLIAVLPTIGLAALLDLVYYRAARFRVFVWPGILVVAVFGMWQAILVMYLGPQTSAENLAVLRETTAGAAAVFSPDAMRRAVRDLVSFSTYGSSLLLALPYAFFCSIPRSRRNQQWGILFIFVAVNLVWFVFASIGWIRYAFAGLAFSSLFVAKFILDLWPAVGQSGDEPAEFVNGTMRTTGLRAAIALWALAVVMPSLYVTLKPIVRPPANAPVAMAAYLTRDIPESAVVETWEQELGALSQNNFHYPPARLLPVAVRHIWLGGPPPGQQYHPLEEDRPPYVVVGAFSRWVNLYPADVLERDYSIVTKIGAYDLYRRKDAALDSRANR